MTSAIAAQVSRADLSALLAAARALDVPPEARTRIDASVVRPLEALVAQAPDAAAAAEPAPRGLWELALWATALCASPRRPPALLEATAALQALAVEAAAESDKEPRRAQLRAALAASAPSIRAARNGPLLVTNVPHVRDWLGCAVETCALTALCRCGKSARKPLCDGSHAAGFDDAKDPKRVPDRHDTYDGVQITVFDNRGTCQHSGFCSDRLPNVFRTSVEPFVAASGGRMDEIVRAVRDCPSGALSYGFDGIEERADVDFHHARTQPHDGWFLLYGAIVPLLPTVAIVLGLLVAGRYATPHLQTLTRTWLERSAAVRTSASVAGFSPAQVRGALAHEPPHAAAAVISALPAATAAAVLELYPPHEREAIVKRMQRAHSPLIPDAAELLSQHA